MGIRWKNTIVLLLSLLLISLPLPATKDRPCRSGEFRLSAKPAKRAFANGEPVTIRLSFTNLTSRAVYIVPYMFPFDYWVDKHKDGRWAALSTGIGAPNARERRIGLSGPAQPSEYRKIQPGETFTGQFEVELRDVTTRPSGTFRVDAVRAYVYESNSAPKNAGCAIFTTTSDSFTAQ